MCRQASIQNLTESHLLAVQTFLTDRHQEARIIHGDIIWEWGYLGELVEGLAADVGGVLRQDLVRGL